VDFDSSSIVKIIFRFDKNESGKIMIDNIGFGR
jgi:ABC-type transport system involved in Fe-S cluster assembly fused permease/ATPase subunit